MMTALLVVVFAVAVVSLLLVTPVLQRWATAAPSPVGGPLDADAAATGPAGRRRQA